MTFYVLCMMIFAHIVDDYYLQGVLAKFKQKKWWKENYPDKMYRFDYIVGLLMHAFSWSFMTSLPLLLISKDYTLIVLCIGINTIIHAIIDHLKANLLVINLFQDQLFHMMQLIVTLGIFL